MRRLSARMTFTQLVTIARVTAISRTMRTTRVRLCFMARRMGPIWFMGAVLLDLELHGGRHRAHAPCRIDAGEKAGGEGETERHEQHLSVEVKRLAVLQIAGDHAEVAQGHQDPQRSSD